MNLRRMLLIFAMLALAGGPLLAQAGAGTDALFGSDSRLDQKITLDADGVPVASVLANMSRISGVSFTAGVDKDDWMVQDRKLIVHVKDFKLSELMREISGTLRFSWSRQQDAPMWTYQLTQDKQERAQEFSLRANSQDSEARTYRQKREDALSDLVNLVSLRPADAAGLKATDPWRYVLATEPLGKGIADFISAFADARAAFVQGTEAEFPVSTLPPQLQETVRRIASSYDGLIKSIGQSEDHADLLRRLDRLQITINPKNYAGATDVESRSLLGRIVIGSGSDSFEIPLFDPATPLAKALGRAILALKAGSSKDAVGKQTRGRPDICDPGERGQPRAGQGHRHRPRNPGKNQALRHAHEGRTSDGAREAGGSGPFRRYIRLLSLSTRHDVVLRADPG